MQRCAKGFGRLTLGLWMAASLVLSGCGGGSPPSVSGSSTEVTVHGVVKYKGEPVKGGKIQFDPGNINRRDAKPVGADIGPDGTYTIKTLYGENVVSFDVPTVSKKDQSVMTRSYSYSAPSGDSTYDIELNNP
ncbi:hypothetical protein TA3x_000824 [Tundrisphaera sp. TA3]|uniref:hypothetical protein n=1 Tax=Tundrisphaera sp. TA3 TaxID=3435775 RepID=UPI003EC0DA06